MLTSRLKDKHYYVHPGVYKRLAHFPGLVAEDLLEQVTPAIDDLMDIIVEYIMSKNGVYTKHDDDLMNYREPDYQSYNDEDENYLYDNDKAGFKKSRQYICSDVG